MLKMLIFLQISHEKECCEPLFKHFNFNFVLLKYLQLKAALKHDYIVIIMEIESKLQKTLRNSVSTVQLNV